MRLSGGPSKWALKPWLKQQWWIPSGAVFFWRLEEWSDLYAERDDPQRPVVCFEERPYQLVGETRQPLPRRLGQTSASMTNTSAMGRPICSSSSNRWLAGGTSRSVK